VKISRFLSDSFTFDTLFPMALSGGLPFDHFFLMAPSELPLWIQ
jgi:hypothetical protein